MSKHLDLEFHIGGIGAGWGTVVIHAANHKSPAAAFKVAQEQAAASGFHTIDVVCWSRGAALLWAGEYGGEEYDADPDASVHDRLIFDEGEWKSQGRVA